MTNQEIKDRLLAAVDQKIENWRKADKITQIEQEVMICHLIWGIGSAALHLLPTEDYYKFKEQVKERGYLI